MLFLEVSTNIESIHLRYQFVYCFIHSLLKAEDTK